jgi:hypothetical protein
LSGSASRSQTTPLSSRLPSGLDRFSNRKNGVVVGELGFGMLFVLKTPPPKQSQYQGIFMGFE